MACKLVPELVKKNFDEIQQLIHQAASTEHLSLPASSGQEKRSELDDALTNDNNKRLKLPSTST